MEMFLGGAAILAYVLFADQATAAAKEKAEQQERDSQDRLDK